MSTKNNFKMIKDIFCYYTEINNLCIPFCWRKINCCRYFNILSIYSIIM